MQVGVVKELYRYPVKSMQGESIQRSDVTAGGLAGDRAWAVRDEVNGGIRGAKKIASLMQCAARFPAEPAPGKAGTAEMVLPDGTPLMCDAPDAAAKLSDAIGHKVTLWPLMPADQLDHYRRGAPTHPEMVDELRAIFGREGEEPLPDLSVFPPELMEFESVPGTYFDAFPLMLMTDASMKKIASLAPESNFDLRRFRPNVYVEMTNGEEGFVEQEWIAKTIRIGEAVFDVTACCPRCVMTTHGFADVPKDPQVLRTIVREADQNLGVYAINTQPGLIAVGDTVIVEG